jgi:hypothetical protein
MGRPPIGKVAMTSAERVARYRAKHGITKPSAAGDARLQARIAELQAENAALAARIRELEQPTKAERPSPRATPQKPLRPDRAAMAAQMQAQWEADKREMAQWGGRPKSLVIDDIKRLLQGRGHRPDDVTQTIIDALAPHVRDQANIERGIPRRAFRKALADLHTDRNPANAAAFIALKELDEKHANGKPNRGTIVIADNKVRSMSDYWRKRQEQSERARAKRRAAAHKRVR